MIVARLKVNDHIDRGHLCDSLLNSGHKVWIEQKKEKWYAEEDYYVCFELEGEEVEYDRSDKSDSTVTEADY